MTSARLSDNPTQKSLEPRGNARLASIDCVRGLSVLLMIAAGAASLPFSSSEKTVLGQIAAYAAPFAAPAFFLAAGLMLHNALKTPWTAFLLNKVAPLIWRYVLWGLAGALMALWLSAPFKPGYLLYGLMRVLIDPPAMLLILCALPMSFIVLRALRVIPLVLLLPFAIALEITTSVSWGPILASFCRLFVYLYVGYVFAIEIKALARFATTNRTIALYGLVIWAVLNGLATFAPIPFVGAGVLAQLPFASLGLGLLGAMAMIVLASLIESSADSISARPIGERALAVYLTSFLLIEALRGAAIKFGGTLPSGAALLIVSAIILASVFVALIQQLRTEPAKTLTPEEFAPEEFTGGKPRLEMASRTAAQ